MVVWQYVPMYFPWHKSQGCIQAPFDSVSMHPVAANPSQIPLQNFAETGRVPIPTNLNNASDDSIRRYNNDTYIIAWSFWKLRPCHWLGKVRRLLSANHLFQVQQGILVLDWSCQSYKQDVNLHDSGTFQELLCLSPNNILPPYNIAKIAQVWGSDLGENSIPASCESSISASSSTILHLVSLFISEKDFALCEGCLALASTAQWLAAFGHLQ